MPNSLDTESSHAVAALVTFHWGINSIARYTSWTEDLVLVDGTFASQPSIEIKLGQQHGGSQDTPIRILTTMVPPLDALTSQRAHGEVRVVVEEIDPIAGAATRRKLFAGIVLRSTRNPDGRTGLVDLEIAGWRLALAVGVNAWASSTTCNNTFGDQVCRKDVAALRDTATITAINGSVITLSGLSITGLWAYWRAGYVERDGLAILVREYGFGSNLTLLKIPPADWLGEVVTVTPGCDKRALTCLSLWANMENFTGFGIGMPAYNPLLESPA